MNDICVLGAGYMGSAITFPLAQSNNNVSLWGTWLDDEIIKKCKEKLPHPKLGTPLSPSVKLFYSDDLEAAVEGSDIIFMGISSEGFLSVFERLLEVLDDNKYIYTLTKGFVDEIGRASCRERV